MWSRRKGPGLPVHSNGRCTERARRPHFSAQALCCNHRCTCLLFLPYGVLFIRNKRDKNWCFLVFITQIAKQFTSCFALQRGQYSDGQYIFVCIVSYRDLPSCIIALRRPSPPIAIPGRWIDRSPHITLASGSTRETRAPLYLHTLRCSPKPYLTSTPSSITRYRPDVNLALPPFINPVI